MTLPTSLPLKRLRATYVVSLEGAATGAGTMLDPLVAVWDSTYVQVLVDDDSGVSLNSLMQFEVTTRTYYIASHSTDINDLMELILTLDEMTTPPVARDDRASVDPGETVRINIGLNDTDANEDFLSSSGLTNPSRTVSYTDNNGFYDFVNYTVDQNASGTDSFTYSISDGQGGSDTATVTAT